VIIGNYPMNWIHLLFAGLLWILVFAFVYSILDALPRKKKRWPLYRIRNAWKREAYPSSLLAVLWVPKSAIVLEEMRQLLLGCGLAIDATAYFLCKRLMFLVAAGMGGLGYFMLKGNFVLFSVQPAHLLIVAFAGGIFILLDKKLLEWIKRRRREKIIKEVYALSRQLLYYEGSSMNLHSKLIRCIPFTRTIREQMYLLTSEWYQDSALAVNRFKTRLGTEEGYSFGETINSLRYNESARYYELLRERIQDYKEKTDLARESKKETTSYVLFILAGIPILNTFRVFAYPWIAEGRKLFDSLA
jgi:hypothetical protein